MQYKLFRTALVSYFGKNSDKPLTTAIWRTSAAYFASGLTAWLLIRMIQRSDLPPGIPVTIACAITAVLGFLLGSIVLISLVSKAGSPVFEQTIRILPVAPKTRWILSLLPHGMIVGSVAIISVSLPTLASQTNLPICPLVLAWLLGVMASLGLSQAVRPRSIIGKLVWLVIQTSGSFWLIDRSIKQASTVLLPGMVILLTALPIIGFWQSYYFGYRLPQTDQKGSCRQIIPKVLPNGAWLLIKLIRNRRTLNSLIVASGINIVLAATIVIGHKVTSDPGQVLIVGGILATTLACDIRGLMRRHQPPETNLLPSLSAVVRTELVTALFVGIVCGLPLFFVLNSQAVNSSDFLADFLVLQVGCSVCGLVAGTILVPDGGESGTQLLTAIVGLGLVVGWLKLNDSLTTSLRVGRPAWLLGPIVMFVAIQLIEKTRRHNYGRT